MYFIGLGIFVLLLKISCTLDDIHQELRAQNDSDS